MKTTVSIDRMTIVGNISDMTLEIQQKLSPLYHGFNLDDVVFVEPLGKGRWRLDFNPNHLYKKDDTILFLSKLKNKKITRLDIAFDVFDFPEFMSLRYNAADVSERWFSRSKSLETIYYGSYKSRRLIRQYDKYAEQTAKGITVNFTNWGRLEIQLRGDMVNNWKSYTQDMIDKMVFPEYSSLKYTERAIIKGLQDGSISWGELSKPTKQKYRKLIAQHTDNALLTTIFKTPFRESIATLEKTINKYIFKV